MFVRFVLCALLLAAPRLYADVGLILSEPTADGASIWTSAGHASVYLSRICPETPIKMRLCRAGEPGSVLTSYSTFGEDAPYQWNIVSLNIFLYGVGDEKQRPLYAWPALRRQLQQRFQKKYLSEICTHPPCATLRKAHWQDMVAANFVREVYMFRVNTTLEQDMDLVAKFNTQPNQNRFNGLTHNCADFARDVLNTYFPGAAHADVINDFGFTSPKAISKSFSHYGQRHPELDFRVERFAQIPGHYRPSSDSRKGTEVAFRSKKWLFPMLLKSHELGLFAASYLLTGRFNPDHELRRRPSLEVAEIDAQLAAARSRSDEFDAAKIHELQLQRDRECEGMLGAAHEWKTYRESLDRLVDQAIERGLITRREDLSAALRNLDRRSQALIDENGAVWLDVTDRGVVRRAGISLSNVNAPGSDQQLAFVILLARVDHILRGRRKARELMPQFRADWELLEATRARLDWPDYNSKDEIKVAAGAAGGKRTAKGVDSPAQDHER